MWIVCKQFVLTSDNATAEAAYKGIQIKNGTQKKSNMDLLTCSNFIIPDNSNISILFERVLPSLVSGLLFGGIPPYIVHISNLKYGEFDQGKCVIIVRRFGKVQRNKFDWILSLYSTLTLSNWVIAPIWQKGLN